MIQSQQILEIMKRLRNNLGGSHTVVTYPPLDSLTEISFKDVIGSYSQVKDVNLYIHIAFCEFICPFCHYETTFSQLDSASNKVTDYLGALEKEISLWQGVIANDISSIYIGGGTPTILSVAALDKIFTKLTNKWTIDSIPFCIETSPTTISSESSKAKLAFLKQCGVNRLSIGVQSFSEKLLNRARKETVVQTHMAINNLKDSGIYFNIDLIQDLPGQEEGDIIKDIEAINKYQPDQVTWYTLRIQEQAGWHSKLENGTIELATTEDSIQRRKLIISLMSDIGYICQPGGRFTRTKENDLYKKIRSDNSYNLLGLGASAYSHNDTYFFRNSYSGKGQAGINKYKHLIEEYGCAITHGLKLTDYERSASKMVKGIRYGISLSEITNDDYLNEIEPIIQELLLHGLIENTDNKLCISANGLPFEEEICAIFYSNNIKSILKATL